MKFTTIAFTASTLSAVLANVYQVQLYAKSDNKETDGKGLQSLHEGAGINYFFLGESAEVLSYDDSAKTISATNGNVGTAGRSGGNFFGIAVTGGASATVENEQLTVDGTSAFFATKNVNDPYDYSNKSYAVLFSEEGDAIPISIKVSTVDPAASFSSSFASAATATASSSGYFNGSTTTLTYTSHHSTVITITDCPETVTDCPARHTPETITTVVPVTLTTTYCPESTTPPFLTTVKPVETHPATEAAHPTTEAAKPSQSTAKPAAPAVTTAANGVAKVGVAAGAGIFAAAAYLL